MTQDRGLPLSMAELERLLKAVEPAALLLPPALLRRIIHQDRKLAGFPLKVPHRRSYVIRRDALLEILKTNDLGIGNTNSLHERVILLARPDPKKLCSLPRQTILAGYWRKLLHASIHVRLERSFAEGRIDETGINERRDRIGPAGFQEIRAVLQEEHYLLPPANDGQVYVEFAAVYLELRHFAPSLLAPYFPALQPFHNVDALLAEDIDAQKLFEMTRPEGASSTEELRDRETAGGRDEEANPPGYLRPSAPLSLHPPVSPGVAEKWIGKAERAAQRGNVVRAAILTRQAADNSLPEEKRAIEGRAQSEIERLAHRLQHALHLSEKETEEWRSALISLLARAARRFWPVETRFLYDLQKVCLDHEREIYSVDLLGWMFSLGRRPLKIVLSGLQHVSMLKHLRKASRRLESAKFIRGNRQRLTALMQQAIEQTEARLRAYSQPIIEIALKEVGFKAQNLPERVAGHKLTEELLDRIEERGFLTMPDLRDAVSRNNMKLPDLAGPGEFFFGDRLLLANRRLAQTGGGTYRGGEIYLRWLQRLSSLAFGTPVGRFLTRYVALPFGGAFVTLEGLQHVVSWTQAEIHLVTPASVAALGTFLLGLLYVKNFRKLVAQVLGIIFHCGRWLTIELPSLLLRLPPLQLLYGSAVFVFFRRFLLKPMLVSLVFWGVLRACGANAIDAHLASGAIFVLFVCVLNTRLGRAMEDALVQGLFFLWERIGVDLVPGLFRWVISSFKWLVETADQLLYTVDETLRFRTGDSRPVIATKAVVGLGWFFVSYILRFCINLLIEPQVNPIKHFPVVTVSHKLVLGLFVPPFTRFLALTMEKHLAGTVAFTIGTGIPGIFGFLVWELKENWRLYRANQPATLRPVVIGHHGETMIRFLRRGIHSGTLPKLYAKLRRAERIALETGHERAARKHRAALHHVEEDIRHFVERELAYLLESTQEGIGLSVGETKLATNLIQVELFGRERGWGEGSLELVFEEHGGKLLGRVSDSGGLARLSPEEAQLIWQALAGFFKMAGVDLAEGPPMTAPESITWQEWVETWERSKEKGSRQKIGAVTGECPIR